MIKDILETNEKITPNSNEMAILRKHFPACFHIDGTFDIKRFKEFLNDKISITEEGYELKFLGKNYARLLASLDTTTVIVPDDEHNNKPENNESKNIYISGDNLDGLKHLLKSYAHKVKCIYIDPPYNTGSDGFIYNDKFNFSVSELSEKLSIDEVQSQRIIDFTKRGSASHSAWLMFMYPRLILARDLLADNGAIFISIDDNEGQNLKLLCDDVFGEENFVSSLAWQSRTSIQNDTDISVNHEYVYVYARIRRQIDRRLKESNQNFWFDQKSFVCQPVPLDISNYSNPDNDPRGPWKTDPFDAPEERENLSYGIENPNTHEVYFPAEGRHWSTEKEKYKALLADGRILFGQNGNARPQLKVFYDEKKAFGSVDNTWFTGADIGTATSATKEQQRLFGGKSYFDTPKPISLINKVLSLALSDKEDSIVVDFFSGSATTAEAVMRTNLLRQNKIKFIMIQLPDNLDSGFDKKTNNQKKKIQKVIDFFDSVHRPHTLDQIGIERIIRAAAKIREENPNTTIDLGFKHFTLVEPSMKILDKLDKFTPQDSGMFIKNTILEDFGKNTVLITWLVRDGYGFTTPVFELDFAGYKGYSINKHLYLIEPNLSENVIEAIVEKYETDVSFNPENVVLFGYSFTWTEIEQLQINLKRLKDTAKNLRVNFDIRY